MKNLTAAEQETLNNLLYLVTHHEEVNKCVLSSYSTLRVGNSGMASPADFALSLESLLAKSCK